MYKLLLSSLLVLFILLTIEAQTMAPIPELTSWTRTGAAFDHQPVNAADVFTDNIAPITLGGDYWRQLTYPLGQQGARVIATAQLQGDGPTGTLTSPPFTLDETRPYFSVLIGGTEDLVNERVELQVRPLPNEAAELERRISQWKTVAPACALDRVEHDGDYLSIVAITGAGYEQLRQVVVQLPDFVFRHEARVRLLDTSSIGHLNVDSIAFTSARPASRPTPVWGYADYHTHPMSYMAFGGLKGVHAIWGVPGGNYEDYVRNPSLVNRDLPRCVRGHDGGPFANPFLNAAQKLQYQSSPDVLLFAHGKNGAPTFEDFPSFHAGTHEQMHITEIRRNYEGGLRLLVGLATDNLGAQYLVSKVENNHVRLVKEKASLEAQLAGIQDLARLNPTWMQVAYTPEEARDIILHNKLAVIMGVEVDQLGTYFSTPKEEVDYLWNHGVRVVTPIHAANNDLGGAAVFIGPYNWLNDLLHRGIADASKKDLERYPAKFFQIKEDSCEPNSTRNDGECVQFRLEWDKQQRLYLGRCLESFFRKSPCLQKVKVSSYQAPKGHKNQMGLTMLGNAYLDALMDRGMIIDTAHMSDESVEGTFAAILKRLVRDHPECAGYNWQLPGRDDCNALAYPAIISHAHFRAQALYGEPDTFPPSEYDISNHNLDFVQRVGGVVGPFVAEDRISTAWDPTFARPDAPLENDCAQSSKSFAYSFHYASNKVSGVGMATDFTFIPSVAPRFGKEACWAYQQVKNPGRERRDHPERYNTKAQSNGVLYEGRPAGKGVSVGDNVPLKYNQLGSRIFDINVDGVAHFGMIPDMLQDLKNLHFPRQDFQRLFNSAEAYITMWEKTERAAHPRP